NSSSCLCKMGLDSIVCAATGHPLSRAASGLHRPKAHDIQTAENKNRRRTASPGFHGHSENTEWGGSNAVDRTSPYHVRRLVPACLRSCSLLGQEKFLSLIAVSFVASR